MLDVENRQQARGELKSYRGKFKGTKVMVAEAENDGWFMNHECNAVAKGF